MDHEKEALLQKVKDYKCRIAEQEEEIKRLVNDVDNLSDGQAELNKLKAELQGKNNLMASTEAQLAGLQSHLKNTIGEVACETTCLKAHINKLEHQVEVVNKQLQDCRLQINMLKAEASDKDRCICRLSKEVHQYQLENEKLQSENCSKDEHFEKLLKQSKAAAKLVAEELAKHCAKGDLSGNTDILKSRIQELEEELAKKI